MTKLSTNSNEAALRVTDQATPWHTGIDATHANWQSVTGLPYFVNPSGTDILLWTALTSPLTTKGDILTFSTVPARLAVGANNTVFVADSAQTTGNKWTAALTGLTIDNSIIGGVTPAAVTGTTGTFTSVKANGTGGAGYHESVAQSSAPSTPASGFRLYAGSSHQFRWIGQGGFVTTLDSTAISADRAYTLPNASGNVLLDTATQNASNKTITASSVDSSVIGGSSAAAITGTSITATTGFVGPYHKPAADAVAAVQVTNAAGSTVYTNWDTTNGFIGLGSGMTAPQAGLHLGPNGALAQIDGDSHSAWFNAASYTNFILQSNTFTNASWTKTGVTAAATATDPTIAANGASNITAGGLSTDGLSQAITNSTTGLWTFSVWLKAQSGTCNVDLNIVSDGETPTKKTVALTTTWKRFFVTQNLTVVHTTKTVSIANGTNAIAVWHADLDNSSYMRGYVSTGAAAVTSVGNVFQTYTSVSFLSNVTVGGTLAVGGKTTFVASGTSAASFVVPTGAAPSSPVEGDHWNDSTQKAMIAFVDGIKQARVGALFTMNASATVASTASETTLVTTGVGTMTLPANFAVVGKTLRIRAWGFYSTTGTPTLQFRVKIGTTVVGDTTAKTTASGVANGDWYLEMDITIRATGASGNVFAQGRVEQNAGTPWPMVNTAVSAAIDTTATKLVDVLATWGTSSSSNTITCSNLSIEVLN